VGAVERTPEENLGRPHPELTSLCLREEHEDAGPAVGLNRVLFFLRPAGNCHAVTVFVLRRFSIHEEHVVVSLVRGNIVERDVPGVEGDVALERDFFPRGERADNFHAFRRFSPPLRHAPTENFGITGRAFLRFFL